MPFDPVEISIFSSLFASIAEEMGVTLARAAYSPNIKERRDHSCAVFDPQGRMVAQAAHIPVHLGAMPHAVRVALERFSFSPGDMVIFNDPYLGGTHLPDITIVSPVFVEENGEPRVLGYMASRAHHADVGGMSPGSMPVATELYQEGIIIPPLKLRDGGVTNEALLEIIYRNVRTPEERKGDLAAQMAAHHTGEARLLELADRYGRGQLIEAMSALMDYSEALTRAALRSVPDGQYAYEDFLDDAGSGGEPISIKVTVTVQDGSIICDFTGSAPDQEGSVNAVLAVTQSSVYYVARCLVEELFDGAHHGDVPSNEGCFRPVQVIAPEGCVLNPRPPRAVSAGNVETSQRIVDVVLGALAQAVPDVIPAASQGTMNNITLGGYDPVRERPFAYYETVGGGAGAGPRGDGESAIHTHMTNTLNTPVEALEFTYPFRVVEYSVRRDSGGDGRHRGGAGIVRAWEFLCPTTVTVITERRRHRPYGLQGGEPGQRGLNRLVRANGKEGLLRPKVTVHARPGDRLIIMTPGGGGWGQ